LSALQLEAVTYACQQHDQILPGGIRAGYLIGDGAGVGKGRTVSGVIFENYLKVSFINLIHDKIYFIIYMFLFIGKEEGHLGVHLQ